MTFFFALKNWIKLLSLNFQLHTSLYIYLYKHQTVSILAFQQREEKISKYGNTGFCTNWK